MLSGERVRANSRRDVTSLFVVSQKRSSCPHFSNEASIRCPLSRGAVAAAAAAEAARSRLRSNFKAEHLQASVIYLAYRPHALQCANEQTPRRYNASRVMHTFRDRNR